MTEPNDDDGILNAPATSFRRTPATVKGNSESIVDGKEQLYIVLACVILSLCC